MKRVTNNCTGCSACIKKCPKKAIGFTEDNLFEVAAINESKCIDCSKCYKLCPSNNKKEPNNPEIKVARLDNDDIMKSASGGIFGELARYILKRTGIVYGAVYTDDFYEVHHVRCDDINKLDKILKSKYVRSNMEDCYSLAEKDLKNGRTVLFSGTPCQIAGLKCYLQKDYDNLYTVDIICHGTPSSKIYKKYIEELEQKENSKIIYIDFRYFNPNDPSKGLLIKFENGKVLNEALYNTSYGRAFLTGLINDDCCGDCKFNDFRNYSDITLGDAWGYHNKKYSNKNSLVFLNTEKGQLIYKNIRNKLIEFEDYNVNDLIMNNYPLIHSTFNHYNTDKVNLNTKDIDKELWYWLDEKKGLVKDKNGVGILNFHYENFNYGANLVAYSLSKVIKDLGYNPYVIDFDPFLDPDPITRVRTLEVYKFRQKYLNMTPRFKTSSELNILNDYLDMYVVGSDQVWRKAITQQNLKTYFLDFVKDKNKISYAASFGKDHFEGNDTETIICATLLSDFYKISVRENEAKDICNNTFGQDTQVVLDPTLLLTREDYENIIDDQYNEDIDVAVYFVMDHENKILENEYLKKLFPNKKIVNVKGEFKEKTFGNVFVFNSISKWLDGIRKSEYVVTDSYHGLIFSIIFNKKVILIGKNSAALSRFTTIFEILKGNLEKINYSELQEVKDIKDVLDYKEINENIAKYRKISIKFLKDNLGIDKIKKEPIYQSKIREELIKLTEENNELKEQINNLKGQYNSLVNSRSWKVTKPIRYVRKKFGDRNG